MSNEVEEELRKLEGLLAYRIAKAIMSVIGWIGAIFFVVHVMTHTHGG